MGLCFPRRTVKDPKKNKKIKNREAEIGPDRVPRSRMSRVTTTVHALSFKKRAILQDATHEASERLEPPSDISKSAKGR